MTPTARSLKYLRDAGWVVATVERWLPIPGGRPVRSDAFGFGDLLAAHPLQRETALVQVTTAANVSARVRKIQGLEDARSWLAAGNLIWVHGWDQNAAGRWRVRVVQIVGADVAECEVTPRRRRGRKAKQRELFE